MFDRACLDLIDDSKSKDPVLQIERDLISAVDILRDQFSIGDILPVKIRLSSKREDLIHQAIRSSPTAYRKVSQVNFPTVR